MSDNWWDDEYYNQYRTDLTDELLAQYDWLTKDCFVVIERVISDCIDNATFSINQLWDVLREEGSGDTIIKLIEDNVGTNNVTNMLALMLAALNYKILKIIDTKSKFKPLFLVSLEKERLEAEGYKLLELLIQYDSANKRFKTVYIKA